MTGNDAYDRHEEQRIDADRPRQGRSSWLSSRPQSLEQVVGVAAASAGAAFFTSLILGRGAGSALGVAIGFGGATLLVQGVKYRRWDRQGRPNDPPPNLPPYGGDWPPPH